MWIYVPPAIYIYQWTEIFTELLTGHYFNPSFVFLGGGALFKPVCKSLPKQLIFKCMLGMEHLA